MRPPVLKTRQFLGIDKISAPIFKEVNFSKDDRVKIEVPDPLAIEDLISYKLNNRRQFARLIIQYRTIFSNRHGLPSSGCYRE